MSNDNVDDLAETIKEVVEAWDWWRVDPVDRCSSVVSDAIANLRAAKRQADSDYDQGRRDMAKEVFALHEDTIEQYHSMAERDTEGKQGAFARGRMTEAKSIAKAIGAILPSPRIRSAHELGPSWVCLRCGTVDAFGPASPPSGAHSERVEDRS